MRQFYTVVLERMNTYNKDFYTEPYETGWASEAIFFLRVHDISGKSACLRSWVQISVDGIEWINEGNYFLEINREGNYFIRVSHFGGWLRLANMVYGDDSDIKLTIHLALKE